MSPYLTRTCAAIILLCLMALSSLFWVKDPPPDEIEPEDYVLQYTLIRQDETLGTYFLNVVVYDEREPCAEAAYPLNRDVPVLIVKTVRFKMSHAECFAIPDLGPTVREQTNYDLKWAAGPIARERII